MRKILSLVLVLLMVGCATKPELSWTANSVSDRGRTYTEKM